MKLNDEHLKELAQFACEAAVKAAELIASYTGKDIDVQNKEGGDTLASQVVTEVDQKSEAIIVEYLSPTLEKYDLALLSEEREDDRQRLSKDYFWCIDPLDGTLAFTESKPGYAVSIALVSREGEPQIGVVCDPVLSTLYSAVKGQGVKRDGHDWDLPTLRNSMFTLPCDRSFEQRVEFNDFLQAFDGEVKKIGADGVRTLHHGGAVMNAIRVLENVPAVYFKVPKPQQGGGSSWDFAATSCIFTEFGFIVKDFHGNALSLNSENTTFMNESGVIYALDPEIMKMVQALWEQI